MPGEAQLTASSGGGSAAFVGPPTSSANTKLKLPADTGSAGQVLKVKSANHSATNAELEWAADAGGKILQVKSASQGDAQSTTADSSDVTGADRLKFHTWGTLITGLSLTITPADNDNKILIMYDVALGSTTRYSCIGISRTPAGGTEVMTACGNQEGSDRRRVAKGSPFNNQGGTNTDYQNPPTVAGTYLDDPQSSVALTYKVYFGNIAVNSNVHTTYINRGVQMASQDSDWSACPVSTLTIMEVSV